MYYFKINTKGITEHYTTKNVSKIHRKISEILQAVSISFTPKMLPSIRTLQKALKHIEVNQNMYFYIENSKITIYKSTIL